MNLVRTQYEHFPYPPIRIIDFPKPGEGRRLSYEVGSCLAFQEERPHRDKRILVCGAGTFETLIIAQVHPFAREIVAVDFSENSLEILKRRLHFFNLKNKIFKSVNTMPLPPIRLVCQDLHFLDEGEFDYILASNVLHHVENPAQLLERLADFLKEEGLLRLVTYPKTSRIWMREAQSWLRLYGVRAYDKNLKRKSCEVMRLLPKGHPLRSCFENCSETRRLASLVDAFFHSLEKSLSPLEWEAASIQAGLELCGEGQDLQSQSSLLDGLMGENLNLSRWKKLQILDDLLELCVNPVLWFQKKREPVQVKPFSMVDAIIGKSALFQQGNGGVQELIRQGLTQPSRIRWELGQALKRAQLLFEKNSKWSLKEVLIRLRSEVGARKLSLSDYSESEIAEMKLLPEPWSSDQFEKIEQIIFEQFSGEKKFRLKGVPLQFETLARQAEWLQLRYGAEKNYLQFEFEEL